MGQSRETGNTGYTKHKVKTNKTKYTTQFVLDTAMHSKQAQKDANKTWSLLQTTGGKDESHIRVKNVTSDNNGILNLITNLGYKLIQYVI